MISRKNDSAVLLYDIATGDLADDTHTYNDVDFKVFPNTSLEQFYNSLNILAYTVTYTELLTTI